MKGNGKIEMNLIGSDAQISFAAFAMTEEGYVDGVQELHDSFVLSDVLAVFDQHRVFYTSVDCHYNKSNSTVEI